MHILQVLVVVLLLLQTIDVSSTQLNRDRRSPNITGIRLAGIRGTSFRGRIEIQGPNGTWGTICDDRFDVNDAKVVCRMLGFTNGYAFAYDRPHFGSGSGPIWLDELGCSGTETSLEQCSSSGWGQHNCGHGEDATVACKTVLGVIQNIRLAGNGSTNSRGRVEVLSPNGTWGTICDSYFDPSDAKVICRMLGFGNRSHIAYYKSYFGAGFAPVSLYNLDCEGHESDLNKCFWSEGFCSDQEESGVECGIDAVVRNIRLVGRRGTHEGRAELLGPDGNWGTLGNIDPNAANVICRMLGYDKGYKRTFDNAFYGEGSGPIYSCFHYKCTGQESNIAQCCTSGFRVNYYNHGNDVGVSCRRENGIRLVGGNSDLEGRVEVYHNGVWGTVCNNGFDSRDAEVICYMLGFDTRSIQLYRDTRYGSGTGKVWLENVSCNGTESTLDECPSLTWGSNSCSHSQDVGLDCRQSVRLFGGRYPSEGYVQIGNDWQTISRYYYFEAQVVCRSLHFNTSFWEPTFHHHHGYVTPSVTRLSCQGTESDVAECTQVKNINSYPAYVNCTGNLNGRLVGGAHRWEGKLQIRNISDSRLYRVCTNIWTDIEATLFCQLISSDRYGDISGRVIRNVYGRIIRNTAFDQQPGSLLFLSTQCNGGLPFCIFEVNSTESCPNTDIAMSCAYFEPDSRHPARLVGGQDEYEGRVEIKFNTQWHTLCDDDLDENDAIVVCRSLGYWVSLATTYNDAWFGEGSGPSLPIDPHCNSDEKSILDCWTDIIYSGSTCSHSDDAGVRCTPQTLGKDKVRLAYGSTPSNGKLEVFYNGRWGGVCMKSWTQSNTDVVCRMMMYHSVRPYHSVFKGISTTICIGDLQCHGDEADIGLCKAFLDKSNCTDEVVGIDCFGVNECLSYPCEHGGNCTNKNGTYSCNCPSGWQGKNCSTDVNECLSSPCENGRICRNGNGTYSCDCPPGWQGKNCSSDVNECLSFPCEHGGSCNNVNGTYWCNCPIGWHGMNCSTDVNECLSSPCKHGGNCMNTNGTYSCDCTRGWQGNDCSTDVNECLGFPCEHDGSCNNVDGTYWCDCLIGWHGRNCSTDITKLSTTPKPTIPSDPHHVSPETYELTQDLTVLRSAVGSLAGLLAISVLIIFYLILTIRRMQTKNKKERPHANQKTTGEEKRECYNMSVQDMTKFRNMPDALCTSSTMAPSNESLSDEQEYTTLDIEEKNVEHEYSYLQ